jgi:hypothetical protein
LCLILGIALSGTLLVATILSSLFLAAQGLVVWRHLTVTCGCFGGDEAVGWPTLLRTACILLFAAVALQLDYLRARASVAHSQATRSSE